MNKSTNKHFFVYLGIRIKSKSWYEPARRAFWADPNRLMAVKAIFAIALLAVPFMLSGKPVFAVTLALGALAGALSETDDHPKGRIKSLILKVLSFGLSSLAVQLLYNHSVLLGIGLALSTIFFLLIGGLGERYRGVTFGAILVGIYAMIGDPSSHIWYLQPVLLSSGALFYGLFSLLLLFLHPWRLLDEQLSRGFVALSNYMDEKARLFPSDEKVQGEIRNRLALLNVQVVEALDRCKDVLNSYSNSLKDDTPLIPYLRYFMLLQSLHERSASSHDRYDLLSKDPANQHLMEGIGQLLKQQAGAINKLSYSLLTGIPYRHPVSLAWTVNALNDQLEKYGTDSNQQLSMLIRNLSRSNTSLQNLNDDHQRNMTPRLEKDNRTLLQRLKDQLHWDNPRLRHAIRLSLCFLVGFAIARFFDLSKGEWIVLTCLFVCQPSYSQTRRKLNQRILGTITGVVAAVILIRLLPTLPGQLFLMLFSAYQFFIWMKRNYAVSVVFVTIFVLSAFNLTSSLGIALMLPRLTDTLIGSALSLITVRFLWPDWQYKRLPSLLSDTVSKNLEYFQAILNEYESGAADDDFAYRIARRAAHRADNALALAWQDMQVEPQKKRQFMDRAFTLTYLNHALLSYISALGAHRGQEGANDSQLLVFSTEIVNALQKVIQSLTQKQTQNPILVKDLLKQIRSYIDQTEKTVAKQQFILLYNIAEVTGQLLKQTEIFSQDEKQPG
ncbi:MAG TPA: YccS family putative transporter [Prolixibacteraceae bacterium]|nr:YccS family putative transporter [Prolixibacteraceae bacterium]